MPHFDYLIVGGGTVASFAAEGIRERDSIGTIGILSEETNPSYTGLANAESNWSDRNPIFDNSLFGMAGSSHAELHLDTRVTSIDRAGRSVSTESGDTFDYGTLLLATDGRLRYLDLPADDRVIWFRTAQDYRRLRAICERHSHIAVVGGGYISTELTAALAKHGCSVTLIYPEPVLGGALFPAALAAGFEKRFADAGVTLRAGVTVVKGTADASGITLALDDGSRLTVDAVVSGLGIEPDIALAATAGLTTSDGIIVDSHLVTSDPHIYAAGDGAEYPDLMVGRRSVEHVDNSTSMGHTAGHNMAGAPEIYDHTPYYYSSIFGTRFEAVGTIDAGLDVLEDWILPGERGVVYYLGNGVLVGVLLWNLDGRLDDARRAIAAASSLTRQDLPGLIR